jgi:type VI secretion system protein VasI
MKWIVLLAGSCLAIAVAPGNPRADHAADVKRCAAITDEAQRKGCLSLIVPSGGSPANPAAGQTSSPAVCDPSGDMEDFFKCVQQGQSSEGIAKPSDPAPGATTAKPKRATADTVAEMMTALGQGPSRWRLSHDRSPITDTENVYFTLDSNDVIPRDYDAGEPASLILQCRDNQTNVAITMAGHWFYDEHQVVSRIDKKTAVRQSWIQSTDNKAAFHPSPIAFIRQLATATKLVVQTAPISSPSYTATFDLTGIGEIVKPLRAACGW